MLFAVEVLWSHTTDSMCLAYMSTNDQTPKVSLPACIIYIYVLDYQLRKLKSDRSINRAPAYTLVCMDVTFTGFYFATARGQAVWTVISGSK